MSQFIASMFCSWSEMGHINKWLRRNRIVCKDILEGHHTRLKETPVRVVHLREFSCAEDLALFVLAWPAAKTQEEW